MKKRIIPALLLMLAILTGTAAAQTPTPTQTPAPTQTPYIIYVVVTATPETVQVIETPAAEEPQIVRPASAEPITLMNGSTVQDNGNPVVINSNTGTDSNAVTIVNPNNEAVTVDDLVQRVVSTVSAQSGTTAGGGQPAVTGTGAPVRLSDGTTCTMDFQLVSEPTYPAGAVIPRGEIFWKEWNILNTGTCTWTPEWEFVFNSGWQIGNTRFHMNRTTPPGSVLNVRLAMVPDQKQDGNYYSTYIFEAPDGTQYGTITSSFTVKPASYFAKPTEPPWGNRKPQPGRPARPDDPPCGGFPPFCPPPPPKPWW